MKKVLVTGAAGNIGINVIKCLLCEGKYDITALDLKNKSNKKKLNKYKKRINIVYGDINDSKLIESLIKDKDVVIHLAGVMSPLSNFNSNLNESIDYNGTENIIKAINYYNSNCFFMYPSTTSMYDESLSASIFEKIKEQNLTNFAISKYQIENLIRKKLKKYTIFRLSLVLNDNIDDAFVWNIKKNSLIEVTTINDVSYAFVKGIDYSNELNKKIYNVGMGEKGRIVFNSVLKHVIKYYGLNYKYVFSRILLDKNFYSPILTDSDALNNIINYRNDTLNSYYDRINKRYKKRIIPRLLVKPFINVK